MSETVLIDTGYWIALFDPQQGSHQEAVDKADYLELLTLLVPWPTVYETLRTRFVRRPEWVEQFMLVLRRSNVTFVEDADYRDAALAGTAEFAVDLQRPVSLVDMLCRLVIEDPDVRVDFMLTTNPRDFRDVCERHRVEFL